MRYRKAIILTVVSLLAAANLFAQEDKSPFVVNEVMAANVDEFISPTWNFDSWVELYNSTDVPAELSGLYVSDDVMNLKKFRLPKGLGSIPAHGYKLLWFDDRLLASTNVPFNLDMDGGTLYLSDRDGNLLSVTPYPQAVERVSWARTTDGGSHWAYTSEPTPQADNATAHYAWQQLEAPVVMPSSGFFDTEVNVSVDIPDGCELYYTFDGTLPTLQNGHKATGDDLTFRENTLLRFRLFKEGALASAVTTRSYLKRDQSYYLPTLSVVSDPRFLYDDSIGIYTRGVNGVPGIGQWTKANWNMEWDRPVNMSYMGEDGAFLTTKDVDMKIVGGWSRGAAMKSFKLKGRKEYGGDRNYAYPFFKAKPYLRNRTLHMRNGGNDEKCMLKDAALATIIQLSGIDLDVQSYLPVHHFINGEYKGLINMREPSNKHFVYANQGWDDDEIDVFEINCDSAYIQQCGTREGFERLYELAKNAADRSVYAEIKQWLDIDEYINYMAMSLYLGRGDWPHNNLKGYRKTDSGRLRLVAFDIDAAFEQANPFKYFEGEQRHTFNSLLNGKKQITAEIELVTIFLNLLKNSEFRQQFATAFCLMGGSVFEYQRTCNIVDSLYVHIEPALQMEGKSASSMAATLKGAFTGRANRMAQVMAGYKPMQLSNTPMHEVHLTTDGTPGAVFSINGQETMAGVFDGTLFQPAAIRAMVPVGYRFVGWRRSSSDWSPVIAKDARWGYDDRDTADPDWLDTDYPFSSWPKAISTVVPPGTRRMRCTPMLIFYPSESDLFILSVTANKPFVFYVNGKEVLRHEENGMKDFHLSVPYTDFKAGKNVLAVEFLGDTGGGVYWTGRIDRNSLSGDGSLFSEKEQLHLSYIDEYNLMACYEPLGDHSHLPPVRINEVSADNNISVSDYIKRSDWIELYNTTTESVDLSTLRLSGKPLNLPETITELAPHGHLVVWCDQREPLSQVHADIKLPDGGDTLTLTNDEGTWEDSFSYAAHDGNSSVGRYPDGGSHIYVMHRPTIGAPNKFDSYTKLIHVDTTTDIDRTREMVSPWSLTYASQRLTLAGPNADEARIEVYTAGGQKIITHSVVVRNDFVYVDLLNLPPGIYIARAVAAGKSLPATTLKFKL
ncbi:MAG: CotH kinase family protein [Prevotella sp.]|nr:CotH kinase family protein [Prevotella sp.]